MERPEHDADHLVLSSAELKNSWSYTSTLPYTLMARKDNSTLRINLIVLNILLAILLLLSFFFNISGDEHC